MMVILSTIRPSRTIASTSSKANRPRSNSPVSSSSAETGVSGPHEQVGDLVTVRLTLTEVGQGFQLPRATPGLLGQFAVGSLFGRFAGSDVAGGHFPGEGVSDIAILLHQRDATVVAQGQNAYPKSATPAARR